MELLRFPRREHAGIVDFHAFAAEAAQGPGDFAALAAIGREHRDIGRPQPPAFDSGTAVAGQGQQFDDFVRGLVHRYRTGVAVVCLVVRQPDTERRLAFPVYFERRSLLAARPRPAESDLLGR